MNEAPGPVTLSSLAPPPGAAVLILAPHPDDFDAIGVALRALHERGLALHLAVVNSGASGVDDADCVPPTPEAKAALREAEQRASCSFFALRPERLRFLRLPVDRGGHVVADGANVVRAQALLAELAPALVFLPHGHDTSVGHQRTYTLLRAAARERGREGPRGASGAESTFTACLNRDPKTVAMRYDAVTPYGDREAEWKGELLRCHRSQQRRNLRSRGRGLDERILEMDRDTAQACGLAAPYAEAFELQRFVL